MTQRIETGALQALVNNATPGPWQTPFELYENDWSLDTGGENAFVGIGIEGYGPLAIVGVEVAFGMDDELDANAGLMALAHTLAAEVLELRTEIERLRAQAEDRIHDC